MLAPTTDTAIQVTVVSPGLRAARRSGIMSADKTGPAIGAAMISPRVLRRTTALSGVVAAALLAATACGSATAANKTTKLAPADAVRAGFSAIADSNAATLTLKLDATRQQLLALHSADGSAITSSDQTIARVLDGGTVTLALKTTGTSFAADAKNPSAAGKKSFALDVNAGDQANLVQLDVIDKVLYARADVHKLASYFGPGGEKTVQQFSSGAVARKYPFVTRAVAGDWLKLDLADLDQFAKSIAPGSSPMLSQSQIQALIKGLVGVYDKDVTVTRAAADPSLGDHLVLAGNVRTLGTDLLAALKSSLTSVPGLSSLLTHVDASGLPSKQVQLDAYVKNGALSALRFNLTPYFKASEQKAVGGKPIDVELDVARSASISAPSDATTVTTQQLFGLLGGLGASGGSVGGFGGSTSATASPVALSPLG